MAYDSTKVIKQIQVGTLPYDINALYIQDGSGNGKDWSDIIGLFKKAFRTEIFPTLPVLKNQTDDRFEELMNTIALVEETGAKSGTFVEYIVNGEAKATATWERIGTTETDLSDYVKKGDYTTGNGGAGNTGEADLGSATGTATVTYKKSAAETGSAGATGTSANTGSAGGETVTGTAAVSYSKPNANTGEVAGHTHSITPSTATLNYVTGASTTVSVLKGVKSSGSDTFVKAAIKSASLDWKDTSTTNYQAVVTGVNNAATAGGHSHKIDSHTHAASQNVVTGYPNFSGGSATGTFVTSVKSNASVGGAKNYGFAASTSSVMTAPTVSAAGVLSWTLVNAATQDAHTMTQMTFDTDSVGWTAASLGTASTVSVAGAASAATLNTTSAGDHTHTVGASGTKWLAIKTAAADSTGTAITGVEANGTATVVETLATSSQTIVTGVSQTGSAGGHSHSIGTTPATASGTATVTISDHSHSYTKPADHTHSIALTDTTVTGTASVAVGKHSHSIGNHTHGITL